VREAASRAKCGNNLKQLCLAVHHINDARGRFPPLAAGNAVNCDSTTTPPGVPSCTSAASWYGQHNYTMFAWLLPYIEQTAMYNNLTPSATREASTGTPSLRSCAPRTGPARGANVRQPTAGPIAGG
jgi:hypothetical protein